jgi:hypothetical protein
MDFGAEQVCNPCHLNRRQSVSVVGLVQEWARKTRASGLPVNINVCLTFQNYEQKALKLR